MNKLFSAIMLTLVLTLLIAPPAEAQTVKLEYVLYNALVRDATNTTTTLVPTRYDENTFPFAIRGADGKIASYLGGVKHPELNGLVADSVRFSWVSRHASADSIKIQISTNVSATGSLATVAIVDSSAARERDFFKVAYGTLTNADLIGAVVAGYTGNAKSLTVPNNFYLKVQWYFHKPS